MPEINSRQAMVIEGAEVLDNPHGTAPGMYLEHEGRAVVLLPGPPREMRPMFETYVVAEARREGGRRARRAARPACRRDGRIGGGRAHRARLHAVHESADDDPLQPSEIEIHLTAQAKTERDAELLLDGLAGQIEERLGDAIFAFRGETMEEVIGLRLAVTGFTLATAESCTGGLIAQRMTEVPGSSTYFKEGIVAYSNEAKVRLLGVPADLIGEYGAVSARGRRGDGRRSARCTPRRISASP